MTTPSGEQRRVGVEIELGGLAVEETARLTAIALGGSAHADTDYEWRISSPLGEVRVEYDSSPLKKLGRVEDTTAMQQLAADVMESAAGRLFPTEIVLPPIAFSRLGTLDALIDALEASGAKGTESTPWAAFGVHFNPELSSHEPRSIRDHLRAFGLLHRWLVQDGDVDLSRRTSGFIEPYPNAYIAEIVDPAYDPTQAELIDDYLRHNPTRNRALDMLPLFAHLDEARVRATVNDDRIKGRPTFHYRLANASLGKDGWKLTDEWARWLMVERLAAQKDLLAELGAAFQDRQDDWWNRMTEDWSDTITALESELR